MQLANAVKCSMTGRAARLVSRTGAETVHCVALYERNYTSVVTACLRQNGSKTCQFCRSFGAEAVALPVEYNAWIQVGQKGLHCGKMRPIGCTQMGAAVPLREEIILHLQLVLQPN